MLFHVSCTQLALVVMRSTYPDIVRNRTAAWLIQQRSPIGIAPSPVTSCASCRVSTAEANSSGHSHFRRSFPANCCTGNTASGALFAVFRSWRRHLLWTPDCQSLDTHLLTLLAIGWDDTRTGVTLDGFRVK